MTRLRNDLQWLRPFPWFWFGLVLMMGLRYIWAAAVPFGNDEAYYWDWGRDLQLSYFDHPPGVAWLSYLASHVFGPPPLGGRALVPLMHAIATVLLAAIVGKLSGRHGGRAEAMWLFAMTQAAPLLSLGGFFLMPDAGLILMLSWLMYLASAWVERRHVTINWGGAVLMGVALGLAGCFKYHALPVGGGLMLALCWLRRQTLGRDWLRWLLVVVVAVGVCSPVWIWNYQHDFASFRFQSDHGFGGLQFHPNFALQTVVAQLLLVTPVVFIGITVWAFRQLGQRSAWRDARLLALGAYLPLFLLLNGVGFFKQVLPHWLMPGLWLVIPFYAVDAVRPWPRWVTANFVYGALVTLCLPTILSIPDWRRRLPSLMAFKPGGLGEITLWDSLVRLDKDEGQVFSYPTPEDLVAPSHCPMPFALGSFRWFWVAQLAANLEDHPLVFSFDLNKTNYYSYRDATLSLSQCPVLLIGNEKHYDREKLSERVQIHGEQRLVVPDHLDQPVIKVWGIVK